MCTIDNQQKGGKIISTSGFYFLFYGQSQLPIQADNNFVDNLRINENVRKWISSYQKNNDTPSFFKKIQTFNNTYVTLKNINIENNNDIFNYILYLCTIGNSAKTESNESTKQLMQYIITNEFNKFSITLENVNKLNIKTINTDTIKTTLLNNNFQFKTLYSPENNSIINLCLQPDNLYQFQKKSNLPSYNTIIETLLFSFIIANKSNLIKLGIVENHKYMMVLSGISKITEQKNKLIEYIKNNMKKYGYSIQNDDINKIINSLLTTDNNKVAFKIRYSNIMTDIVQINSKNTSYKKATIIKKGEDGTYNVKLIDNTVKEGIASKDIYIPKKRIVNCLKYLQNLILLNIFLI